MNTMLLSTAMSFEERMSYGFQVFAIGMLTVFAVLAILYLALLIFKVIFYKEDTKKEAVKKVEAPVKKKPAPARVPTPIQTPVSDDTQLIAVLTAAIAAYQSENGYTLPFRVVSYKRTKGAGGWNSKNI